MIKTHLSMCTVALAFKPTNCGSGWHSLSNPQTVGQGGTRFQTHELWVRVALAFKPTYCGSRWHSLSNPQTAKTIYKQGRVEFNRVESCSVLTSMWVRVALAFKPTNCQHNIQTR
ncbi:hypothetical protein J6590_062479 [Homalodisca vitripennis]|nr:hypothetical protein J6590_062479 [Homalodisca vitripennis]